MRRHRVRAILIATLAVLTLLAVIDLGFADGAMFVGFLDPLVHPKQVQGPPELGPDLPRASRADSLSCDGLPVKELFLDNPLGSIDIVGTDGDEIRVNYDVTVYAKSQAVARAYLAEVQVEPVPVGDNGLRFSVTEAPLRPETVYYIQVDYRIEAPERLAPQHRQRRRGCNGIRLLTPHQGPPRPVGDRLGLGQVSARSG